MPRGQPSAVGVDLLEGEHQVVGVDGHRLGAVVRLIDPHQAIRQLKHVVPKRDDDKLGIPRPLLKQQISACQEQISQKGCQGHISLFANRFPYINLFKHRLDQSSFIGFDRVTNQIYITIEIQILNIRFFIQYSLDPIHRKILWTWQKQTI